MDTIIVTRNPKGQFTKGHKGYKARLTHGLSGSPTYTSWSKMIQRCTDSNINRWEDYGGKGITVCEQWLNFQSFLDDMGIRPIGMSLDRYPNCSGNYEPTNCRWATQKEQQNNKSTTKWIEINNQRLPVQIAAGQLNLTPAALYLRLYRNWPMKKILSTPLRKVK